MIELEDFAREMIKTSAISAASILGGIVIPAAKHSKRLLTDIVLPVSKSGKRHLSGYGLAFSTIPARGVYEGYNKGRIKIRKNILRRNKRPVQMFRDPRKNIY